MVRSGSRDYPQLSRALRLHRTGPNLESAFGRVNQRNAIDRGKLIQPWDHDPSAGAGERRIFIHRLQRRPLGHHESTSAGRGASKRYHGELCRDLDLPQGQRHVRRPVGRSASGQPDSLLGGGRQLSSGTFCSRVRWRLADSHIGSIRQSDRTAALVEQYRCRSWQLAFTRRT